MQEGHRPAIDAALEAVAHHQVRTAAKALDEAADVIEGIAVVGIGHQDVLTPRGFDSRPQRGAVAAARDLHHAGAGACGDLSGAVRRPVVGHEDLAVDPQALQ